MISFPINSFNETGGSGLSSFDFTSVRNRQKQQSVSGLLSGLPRLSAGIFDSVSPNLLSRIYDSRALTTKVINRYLDKVDEVLGTEEKSAPARRKSPMFMMPAAARISPPSHRTDIS